MIFLKFRGSWVGLQCVIVVLPDHTHFLEIYRFNLYMNICKANFKYACMPSQFEIYVDFSD